MCVFVIPRTHCPTSTLNGGWEFSVSQTQALIEKRYMPCKEQSGSKKDLDDTGQSRKERRLYAQVKCFPICL